MDLERRTIIEFLKSQDPDMDPAINGMSLMDLIDTLIEEFMDTELDYSILSTAFASGVNPGRFEQFHDEVMNQYETVREGEEIPVPVLDRIASQYR
jgi:hypothetical protein